MDEFVRALLAEGESGESPIPQEYDWYAPLLGDWNFEYTDTYGCKDPGEKRHVKGEWMFRRILEGAGIEDLFICPSRETRAMDPEPDTEYGVALRMFNAKRKCYDMVYTCDHYMTRLEIHKDGQNIECHVLDRKEKWVFSDITKDTFRWRNMSQREDGEWKENSEVLAKRKA